MSVSIIGNGRDPATSAIVSPLLYLRLAFLPVICPRRLRTRVAYMDFRVRDEKYAERWLAR